MAEVVIVKAHCNSCLKETNHVLVAKKKSSWSDVDAGIYGEDCYQIVACCGCDTVGFRRVTTIEGGTRETINYFPAAVSRRKPYWLSGSLRREQKKIVRLLDEIYVAVHEDLRVLAATGVRTLIDIVITEHVGDVGNFPAKLSAVEKRGFISPSNREFLEVTIDAGSASAHRGFQPSQQDLKLLLDITENLIASIYVLPGEVKALSKKVPPRPKQKNDAGK
ncbi:MAG: DUF4145 domain-containing protein [Candidatus Binatus sp.]